MKRFKGFWEKNEEEKENLDVYDEDGVELSQENDEISEEEAAFMSGYMGEAETEEEL